MLKKASSLPEITESEDELDDSSQQNSSNDCLDADFKIKLEDDNQ